MRALGRRIPWAWALGAAGLLAGIVAAVVVWGPGRRPPPAATAGDEDPRLAYPTPYRNVRPEVRYVGGAACARCHARHARTWGEHPMALSLAPVAPSLDRERLGPDTHNPFTALGRTLAVERHGGRLLHKEMYLDERGRVAVEDVAEVHYVVGSGHQGRSYLMDRGGYLFQSPISWYSHTGTWELSPGYDKNDLHFSRQVTPTCVFCHGNEADLIEGTVNHYRQPLFPSYGISCERCHGPGELHVRERAEQPEIDGFDDTIVNPARLEPALREAVCEQCHLQGEKRVLRRSRRPFDYRPGLPLHLFVSVFVKPPELTKGYAAVSHVEQLSLSRCFRGSAGKLGCTSCHDPHEVPAPEQRLNFYRGRCQKCHGGPPAGRGHRAVAAPPCSLPAEQRQARQDNCIDCHMPAEPTANIVHAALTDHRIPRRAGGRPPADSGWREHELPMLHFHRDLPGVDPRSVQRDLGITLVETGWLVGRGVVGTRLADVALSKLEAGLREHPEDVAAWEAKGAALWLLGAPNEALKSLEMALRQAPDREEALDAAARCALELNRADDALAYLQRLRAVNPWYSFVPSNVAKIHADRGEWAEALTACREALRLNPAGVESRTLLVQCLVRTDQVEQARTEFATLMALKPPNAAALRRWFAGLAP
jgi:hypothetical protein